MNFRPCVTGRSLEYKLNRIGARTEPWPSSDLEWLLTQISKSCAIIWRWISLKQYGIKTLWQWNTTTNFPYWRVSFRMTLSDLAKYSVTWSIERPVCDSWVSCFKLPVTVTQINYVVALLGGWYIRFHLEVVSHDLVVGVGQLIRQFADWNND